MTEEATLLPEASAGTAYTEADQDSVAKVETLRRQLGVSQRDLAKLTTIASSTISQVLGGKYPASPSAMLGQMLGALSVESARRSGQDGTGYVRGSIYKLAELICQRTRHHAAMGVLCAKPGIGKSAAINELAREHTQTLVVNASPAMSPGVLMEEMLRLLQQPIPERVDAKFKALLTYLRGSTWLVIVDEADLLQPGSMEHLRRLRDLAGVGVVLVGDDSLPLVIKPGGKFDKLRSRIGMWPQTVQQISRDDADAIARRHLHAWGDLSDGVLDALWDYGQGSARVLVDMLIKSVRDYMAGKALNERVIDELATKVLGLPARTKKGGK